MCALEAALIASSSVAGSRNDWPSVTSTSDFRTAETSLASCAMSFTAPYVRSLRAVHLHLLQSTHCGCPVQRERGHPVRLGGERIDRQELVAMLQTHKRRRRANDIAKGPTLHALGSIDRQRGGGRGMHVGQVHIVDLLAVLEERQVLQGSGPGCAHRHAHQREVARVDVGHRKRRGGIRNAGAGAGAENAGKRSNPQSQRRPKADGSRHAIRIGWYRLGLEASRPPMGPGTVRRLAPVVRRFRRRRAAFGR